MPIAARVLNSDRFPLFVLEIGHQKQFRVARQKELRHHVNFVFAESSAEGDLLLGARDGLVAVASDFNADPGVPMLDLNAPGKVADFVEETFLKPPSGSRA